MKKMWKSILMQAFMCGLIFTSAISSLAAENVPPSSCAPAGMTKTDDGGILVTDSYHKVIWKIKDTDGEIYAGALGVTGMYGEPAGGYRDGGMNQALFGKPWAIVPFNGGYAISDPANHFIRLLDGNQVRTINLSITLSNPTGLAVDSKGSLYIADTNNNLIRKVTAEGGVSTWLSGLSEPTGLFFKDGALYIADSGNNRIVKAEAGSISSVIGGSSDGYRDGDLSQALFANPMGVAVDDDGTIYVADTGNGAVRKIRGNTVSTLVSGEGSGSSQILVSPVGLLIDGNSIYVGDIFLKRMSRVDKEPGVTQ